MIASLTQGRIRVRDSRIKMPGFANCLKEKFEQDSGIYSCEVNHRTGSILIFHDSQTLTSDEILARFHQYGNTLNGGSNAITPVHSVKKNGKRTTSLMKKKGVNGHQQAETVISVKKNGNGREIAKITKLGMLSTFGLCMLGLKTGNKTLHKQSGWAFATFTAGHLTQNRNRFFKSPSVFTNIGMFASLAANLIGAALKMKKLHKQAAWPFMIFLAKHLFNYRRQLLR